MKAGIISRSYKHNQRKNLSKPLGRIPEYIKKNEETVEHIEINMHTIFTRSITAPQVFHVRYVLKQLHFLDRSFLLHLLLALNTLLYYLTGDRGGGGGGRDSHVY